jgi:hypothetical protein
LSQGEHAHQVVCRDFHHEDLTDFLNATHHHLVNRAEELAPGKTSFNAFRLLLRDGTVIAGGQLIGHGRRSARLVLCHLGCHLDVLQGLDELACVIALSAPEVISPFELAHAHR